MNPIEFEGCNVVYAKDQDEYLNLPAKRTSDGVVKSCWKMTWKERLIALWTGRIYIEVWTYNKSLQPICVFVEARHNSRRKGE